tara:strand:- start:24040 stop:25224 length:1185 start_codon:yes stop_codon:yes gene_type:complete
MRGAQDFDTIIIGAGAAGLMCAMTAGARGKSVLLLDHADAPGKKILISGGGRCNFTNLHCTAENFLSGNKHFCKSALARYTQHDFIALIDKHGIAWHEKTLGQLFCDTSARDVVAMLLAECAAVHVDIRLAHRITDISRHDRFEVTTDKGVFTGKSLVLASGGLSIPKMGATGFAHDVAEKFGLKLANVRPGLVPLTLQGDDKALATPLSGIATPCVATCGKIAFKEAILFTHRGLSGPAVLQISSYWQPGQTVAFDLLPGVDLKSYLLEAKRSHAKQEIQTVLARHLPTRLASGLSDAFAVHGRIGDIADKSLSKLAETLNCWQITPAGSEGYAKAEVTVGGVATSDLSSQTMAANDVPGLFVIGEAVDVTGWLGGYNFQWAWSSGHAAGSVV